MLASFPAEDSDRRHSAARHAVMLRLLIIVSPSPDEKLTSRSRSQATTTALKREPHAAASKETVGRQAKSVAQRRNANELSTAAQKSARAKDAAGRSAAAHKAARARAGTQSYGQKPVLLLHDSYHLKRAEIVFCGVGCSKPYHF